MEIVRENSAPSMDGSHTAHSLPATSPAHLPNTPSPSAPPPIPPSKPLELNTIEVPRQILQPVRPSKRASSSVTPQTPGKETASVPQFIPQELAEIVEVRQRRERTWHARLLICTSIISNIESTLVDFTDEVSRKEAAAIQAYLKQAISKYAAFDSSPSPPPIPAHSRPGKAGGKVAHKLPIKPAVPATPVAVPLSNPALVLKNKNQPKENNQTQQVSWATVARNGQKKFRLSIPTSSEVPQVSNTREQYHEKDIQGPKNSYTQNPKGRQLIPNNSDTRIFLRIPHDHEWRKLSPAGIREVVVKKLAISPAYIGRIKPVRTGFALSPSSNKTREEILKAGNGLFLSGAKLEPATNWTPLLVPTVPKFIVTLQGRVEITKLMLADEIERVTSIRPDSLKPFGRNYPSSPHKTWMAFFSKAPRPGFRVFDQSGLTSKFKRQQPIDFCKRCNGYHPSRFCSRAPSCGNCGSKMHEEEACKSLTKCKNCGGPHRSDSKKCLARPTRLGAPTKEQLKIYRQVGDREFHAVAKAKAAEEKALEAEVNALSVETTEVSATSSDVNIEVLEESNLTQNPTILYENNSNETEKSAAAEVPAVDNMQL